LAGELLDYRPTGTSGHAHAALGFHGQQTFRQIDSGNSYYVPILLSKRQGADYAGRAGVTAFIAVLTAVIGAAEFEPGDKKARCILRINGRFDDAARTRPYTVAAADACALEDNLLNRSRGTKVALLCEQSPRNKGRDNGSETRGEKDAPL